MARIRTVKPELLRHEDLFEAELDSGLPLRIAFVGMFTVADREGRFKWQPRQLKLDVLPYDQVDFEKVLNALCEIGLIAKYEVNGKVYGEVTGWKKHQVINQREAQSTLPERGATAHVHAHAEQPQADDEYRWKSINADLRETVFARDGHKCLRCKATEDLTVDHIFPQSMGGTHALTNLRTLCRACNSARPVAGEALIEDLAKDGLSMDDMQRTCMHMQAHGEGKGKGREKELEGEREGKGVAAAVAPPPPSGNPDSDKSRFKYTNDQYTLADRMTNPVLNRFPNQKINVDEWADAVRKLNELDGHSLGEITALWAWIVNHETDKFSWADNCRTPMKLRDKKDGLPYFDVIWKQMIRDQQGRAPSQKEREAEAWVQGQTVDYLGGEIFDGEVVNG